MVTYNSDFYNSNINTNTISLESAWSHFGYIPKSTADRGCGLSLEDSRNGITRLSPKAVLLGPEGD